MNVLDVENVVKEYRIPGQPPIRVLDGVSFSVAPGERVAVTGRSGAEILRLLMGFGGKPFALVMVTHSTEAAAQCDRTLRLEGGRLA